MSNYLDMNPGRYKRIGIGVAAGVIGVGIIAGGGFAAAYAMSAASGKISEMYHEWKGDAVPETFPLVEQKKQPQTLDDVLKEGKWKMTSGMELKPAEGTSDAGLHLKEYLKIYETGEAIEGKREGKPEEKIYQKQEEQK